MNMILSVTLWILASAPHQAPPTLIELARTQDGKATNTLLVEQPALRPEQVRDLADLVLYARVMSSRAVLSADKQYVMTEYVLSPLRVMSARTPQVSPKPGITDKPFVVRRTGGSGEFDGLLLTTKVDLYPEDADITPGTEGIFFLTRADSGSHYIPTAGPFAIFRVTNGEVSSLTKDAAQQSNVGTKSLSEFLAAIERRAK
jgi:hypothetical protein